MLWPWGRRQTQVDHLASVLRKIRDNDQPGQMTPLTQQEYLAFTKNPVSRSEESVISEIFSIRVKNNVPWKRLMEIALKYAPEETKDVLREINANDRAISDLLGELAK